MADADEDNPNLSNRNGEENDEDFSEETVDYRFIANVSSDGGTLPKRGMKDFEPHNTTLQSSVLESSREAMKTALSHPRIHVRKNHIIGIYDPETGLTEVPKPMTVHFRTMGRSIAGRQQLYPEEALYLLESGRIDVRWPADDEPAGIVRVEQESQVSGERVTQVYEKNYGLPMSLQAAYAVFLGMEHGGLTLERYQVYAGLKRNGYIVLRSDTWNELNLPDSDEETNVQRAGDSSYWWPELWRRLFAKGDVESDNLPTGPLVTPGLYRNYADVYRLLKLVPFHNPKHSTNTPSPTSPTTSFRVAFNVHKPASTFKKTAPGPPDFRIAVISARQHSGVPALPEMDALFASTPFHPPNENTPLQQKLIHGYRNVVLAIVDAGVVSYLRLADAGFGLENVYRTGPARGGKGGGRGRGGARGRGRGRGRGS